MVLVNNNLRKPARKLDGTNVASKDGKLITVPTNSVGSNTNRWKRHQMPKSLSDLQSGVTLLELMVAIAVLGVLLTVAIPGFNQLLLNNRQVSATNEFIAGIQTARSTAITRNSRVTLCASDSLAGCDGVNWSAGWIAFVDDNANQQLDGGELLLRAQEGADRMQISSDEFGLALSFGSNGRVLQPGVGNSSGQFMVCDSRGSEYGKVIVLAASGRPSSGTTQFDGSGPSC